LYSPIALQEFDEQKYREFLRIESDEELIKKASNVGALSGDGKIVSTMPCAISSEGLPGGVSAEASKIEVSDLRSVGRIITEFSCGNFKLTVSRAHQSYNRF
jgi:hypothetical protein